MGLKLVNALSDGIAKAKRPCGRVPIHKVITELVDDVELGATDHDAPPRRRVQPVDRGGTGHAVLLRHKTAVRLQPQEPRPVGGRLVPTGGLTQSQAELQVLESHRGAVVQTGARQEQCPEPSVQA